MRIGFVSLYSWRPHAEHMYFLAKLVRDAGHQVEFLTCDADLPTCYTREIRDIRPGWQECALCRMGGLRSYVSKNVTSIGDCDFNSEHLPEEARSWALSSASTLGRFESDEDFSGADFKNLVARLQPSVEKAYKAAINWIDNKRLDALVVFNGRMDATRAVFEAGIKRGISVASIERTWFGDGLQILPQENCLGLRSIDRLVSEWADRPLTENQSKLAASHIAARFLRRNYNEWRAYNLGASCQPWPSLSGKYKILLIPSSRNEFWGHPDWDSGWAQPIDAYDALIDHFGLKPSDLVLRCHPNWGENIGKSDGHLPERYFTTWAQNRGVQVVPSTSTVSTLGLIEQSDAVVVSSGSAVLEAGALGKQIIGIGSSNYQQAKCRDDASDQGKLRRLKLQVDLPETISAQNSESIRKYTLRFLFTNTYRVPQYVDYVKAVTSTHYVYREGANAKRLIELLQSRTLSADDASYANDPGCESKILEMMREKQWGALIQDQDLSNGYAPLKRRLPFTGLDRVRSWMRHGDR